MVRRRMCLVFGFWVWVLLMVVAGILLNVRLVGGSGTIFIRVNGSVDPPTAPIKRQGYFYTITGDINDSIIVQMNDIIIDGAGYTLSGAIDLYTKGIDLSARKNVTVRNVVIKSFYYGIFLSLSSDNQIYGNLITQNEYGIRLELSSSCNSVFKNNITANKGGGLFLIEAVHNTVLNNNVTSNGYEGIYLPFSSDNLIRRNNVSDNRDGIILVYSSINIISENNIVANEDFGMPIHASPSNTILGNSFEANNYGIFLDESSNNHFYHNNFKNNTYHVYDRSRNPFSPPHINYSINIWDDGYPSGGNYWSNYIGQDLDGDGIGDTPHVIDENNQDRYPLMSQYIPDLAPPITINNYDGLWHNNDFTITLTAMDDKSDVAQTYYKINNGPTKTVSFGGQPLITKDGANNKLEYWSVDKADNEELPHNILTGIKLDKTAPISNAGVDRTVNEDSSVTFDGSASQDENGIQSYTWMFTDITTRTLTGEKPTYTFNMPGTYTITLNITDAAGNWATDTMVIAVLDITKPVANAGQDQIVNVNDPAVFDAANSTDNVGIVSYQWDFGDWTTGTGKTTTYSYENPGTYTVTLTVKDEAGNMANHSITVTVLPKAEVFPMWIIAAVMGVVGTAVAAALLLKKRKQTRKS